MNTPTRAALSLTLLFAATHTSFAYEAPNPPSRPAESSTQRFDQVLYKGVVGNLLEAVPMEAEQRTTLQRTNAIVSGALSGKSLAALAKLAHPGFLIGGLVWGLWAAANIEQSSGPTPGAGATLLAAATQVDGTGTVTDAVTDTAMDTAGVGGAVEPGNGHDAAASDSLPPAASAPTTPQRQKVVRIWLAPSAY